MTVPTLYSPLVPYHIWGMLSCSFTFMRRERKDESRHLGKPDWDWHSWGESDSPPVWPLRLLFYFCHVAWRHSCHRAIQPCPVNLVIPCRAHAVPGVAQLGGAREVLSQEIPGRVEAARQEGVLRALVRSRLAWRSTEWFGWKVMDTLCPAETTRSCLWAQQRSSLGVFQPHASLSTPTVPGCGLVLCWAKLWFLSVSWQPHAMSWTEQCMSLFPCLVILLLNNQHISVKPCLLFWVVNHYSFRNTF